MSNFLTHRQMASLVEAIQTAENHSSGEIRVHIDSNSEDDNAKTAFEIFRSLNMHKTEERNAVLFHINFDKRYLTIVGDEGIHKKVDRKSTRLNSSHVKISYAVFCLKKKNRINQTNKC